MKIVLIILGILILWWIINSFKQHNKGVRIAFVGQGYLIHQDGKIERFDGIKDIIADSVLGVLCIGSTTYLGKFTPFQNGKKEFMEVGNNLIATVYKSNITIQMADGRIISYSENLNLATI